MIEDRRIRAGIAVAVGVVFTVLSQPFVHFDAHWSIPANLVLLIVFSVLAFYLVSSFGSSD